MGIRTKFNSMGVSVDNLDGWDGKTFIISTSPSYDSEFILTPNNTTEPYINPITIDWGDGTIETYSEGSITHEYINKSNSYDIIIKSETGKMPFISFSRYDGSFEEIKTPLMECYNGKNLQTDFSNVFSGFNGLNILPNVFVKNPQIISFTNAFSGDPNLKKITTIPSELFDCCPNIRTLSSCFSNTYSLKSIPDTIFDNIVDKDTLNLNSCFVSCRNLSKIPELWIKFPNNSFHYTCFWGCNNASNYIDCPYDWGGPTSIKLNVTPSDYQSEFITGNNYYEVISNSKDFAYTDFYGKINYKVYKDGYVPYSNSVEGEQRVETIILKERNIPVTITATPSNANINITVYGETTSGVGSLTVMVGEDAELNYEVFLDGYNMKSETLNINESTNISVELQNIKTIYNLEYPFTNTDLDVENDLFNYNFYVDDESQSIVGASDNYSNLIIPPITNEVNLRIIIDAGYLCTTSWNTCYIYLGTQPFNNNRDIVGNEITDGNGQYIVAFYNNASTKPTTYRTTKNIPIELNTQYYISMKTDSSNKDTGRIDLYSVKVVADDTTT